MKDCQSGKIKELTVMPLMVREFACSKRVRMIFLCYAARWILVKLALRWCQTQNPI
ncbi:hypothetical protein [Clostridium acidisoli]|uniref:hypothetical protein n=1 Tax=Clostridium acidisoli TaxID=91624 RepID=UPI001A9A497A|nr:hypothetical protein [Clostridium acidisoli]